MYMNENKNFVKIEYSYINETVYIKKLQNNEHTCSIVIKDILNIYRTRKYYNTLESTGLGSI